jgi:hypothetical protein
MVEPQTPEQMMAERFYIKILPVDGKGLVSEMNALEGQEDT